MYPCVNVHQVLQPEKENGSNHNLSSASFFPWEISPSDPSASGFSLKSPGAPQGLGAELFFWALSRAAFCHLICVVTIAAATAWAVLQSNKAT